MTASPKRTVACPRCGAAALFAPENRWRPFCSERCRMVDLGLWASEAYRVPAVPQESLPDGAAPGADEQAGGH